MYTYGASVSYPLVERSCAMMGVVFILLVLAIGLLAEEGHDSQDQQHGEQIRSYGHQG